MHQPTSWREISLTILTSYSNERSPKSHAFRSILFPILDICRSTQSYTDPNQLEGPVWVLRLPPVPEQPWTNSVQYTLLLRNHFQRVEIHRSIIIRPSTSHHPSSTSHEVAVLDL